MDILWILTIDNVDIDEHVVIFVVSTLLQNYIFLSKKIDIDKYRYKINNIFSIYFMIIESLYSI